MADPGNAMTLDDRVVKVNEAMRKVGDILRRGSCRRVSTPASGVLEMIVIGPGYGVLVATGSSYGIVDRVFDRNRPLLGLFMPMEVGIISYEDVLSQVGDPLLSALLRDPCTAT
jgi:hypothetical protein